MSHEKPSECIGCSKSGISAIKCPVISRVPVELIFEIQCNQAHLTKTRGKNTSGGILGPLEKKNKPTPVNSAPGRAMSTRRRSGSL